MGSKVQGSEVQDVYDHAGRTRAVIRGFIPARRDWSTSKVNKRKITLNNEPLNP
jgi:hypothetical protein